MKVRWIKVSKTFIKVKVGLTSRDFLVFIYKLQNAKKRAKLSIGGELEVVHGCIIGKRDAAVLCGNVANSVVSV